MESDSEFALARLVSIPKNGEVNANSEYLWKVRGEIVGRHQNASIINTFDGMQEVNPMKETHLYHLCYSVKDSFGIDAYMYTPLENIGEVLGFKGPLWGRWWKKTVALGYEGKRLTLRHFDMGLPSVR